ncbi:MAG: Ig-like domain-containing protein [Vicingaceae bacterium]
MALQGGQKDESPPKLIRSTPDTFSTHFNSDRIKMEFDEFVNLKNANKNLLITPVLRYSPSVLANGKKLTIRNLDDSLWPNTTYVFEFNEAVIDITENNPAKGLRYVFSTGDYVDSLSIIGQIKDAFTLEAVRDAFVFLYLLDDDSIPYKEPPRYMGRSNKQGVFSVKNMKRGNYKVFFCSDENGNYLFDRPSEKIDFLDSMIFVNEDSIPPIYATLFKEERGYQFLKSYGSTNPWSFYLSFKRSVDSLTIFADEGNSSVYDFIPEYNESRDSVVYWAPDSSYHTEELHFRVQADTAAVDTLKISFAEAPVLSEFRPSNNLRSKVLELGEDLEFESPFPFRVIDSSKLLLFRDSIPISYLLRPSKGGRKLTLAAAWKADQSYLLVLDSACLEDISGRVNDSLALPLKTLRSEEYGSLEINLNMAPQDGILFLMDEGKKVVKEVVLKGVNSYYFAYLRPGKYRLKYIVDQNSNGSWDSGNYLKGIHAEEVFIYQGTLTIRSNWDQAIEWKLK